MKEIPISQTVEQYDGVKRARFAECVRGIAAHGAAGWLRGSSQRKNKPHEEAFSESNTGKITGLVTGLEALLRGIKRLNSQEILESKNFSDLISRNRATTGEFFSREMNRNKQACMHGNLHGAKALLRRVKRLNSQEILE